MPRVRLAFWNTAIWLAPAAVLLFERRRLAAAAVLLIATTLFLQRIRWPILSSICLAMVAQSALVLTMGNENLPAVVAISCTALLFWRQATMLRSARQADILLSTLAALLTLVISVRLLPFGGAWSGARADGGAGESVAKPAPQGNDDIVPAAGDFTGIILIPKPEKQITLVPPLPAMGRDIFKDSPNKALAIPFFGVYWFYRFPANRPPPTSVTLHGTPEDFRFRSTGRTSLNMEARQNLGSSIDLSCCSRIEVAIHNLESKSATMPIRIELILEDSTTRVSHTLETLPVDGSEYQVLSFPVTGTAGLTRFDQFTVRVRRTWMLATESARISVVRFVLIPAGR